MEQMHYLNGLSSSASSFNSEKEDDRDSENSQNLSDFSEEKKCVNKPKKIEKKMFFGSEIAEEDIEDSDSESRNDSRK